MKLLRGLVSVLILGSVLLGMAALLIRVPTIRDSMVPGPVLTFLQNQGILDVIGAGSETATPPQTAEGYLFDTAAGLIATGPIAASAGNRPVFVDAIVSGYSTSNSGAVPAEITTIRPILGCMPTRPLSGTLVGHATAGFGTMPIGMATYNDSHLAAAVQAFVDTYRKLGPEGEIEVTGPAYEGYDVVVTETAAPVYLVLESKGGNRIWNIHAAEGARIERVVLLGGGQAGVANLDPVIPVEVLLGLGLAECRIEPAYTPTPGFLTDSDPAEGDQPMRQTDLDQALAKAETYDTWFRDSFGVRAGESRIGFDTGTVSLIGPLPVDEAPKAVWRSVDGAKLRTTHDQFLDIEGQAVPGQDFAGRVIAITTKFAFGDLANLMQGGTF